MDVMSETAIQPGKLKSVQALRGLAAFLVVLFHIADFQKNTLPLTQEAERSVLSGFWDQGFAGVDMFFVLSGFIMVYVTRNFVRSRAAVTRFVYARITRIYPLWWVFAGLMMLYFLVTYGQVAAPDIAQGPDILPYTLRSLGLFPQAHLPVLGIGWTLIHEMFFYGLFALFLFAPRKWLLFLLLGWAGFVVGREFLNPSPFQARNLFDLASSPLNLEFIFGALVALWTGGRIIRGSKALIIFGIIVWILALSVGDAVNGPHLTWHRVWVFGIPSAILLMGLIGLEQADRLSLPHWMIRLGDWSYSLYLSHFLVILALRRIWQNAEPVLPDALQFTAPGFWDNIAFACVAISASIIAASLSYHLIERPLLRFTRQRA